MKRKRFLLRAELVDMEQGNDSPRTVATFASQIGQDYPMVDMARFEIELVDELKYYLRMQAQQEAIHD